MILDVCVSLSRHHVTNQTDSQNAGALPPPPAARQAWRAALLLAAETWPASDASHGTSEAGGVLRRSRPLHPTEPHRDQAPVDHIARISAWEWYTSSSTLARNGSTSRRRRSC
jgi:hypothetical protein